MVLLKNYGRVGLPQCYQLLSTSKNNGFAKAATLIFKILFIILDLVFIVMITFRMVKELKENKILDVHKIIQYVVLLVLFATWTFNYVAISIDQNFGNYSGYEFINLFFVWEHLYIILNQVLWFIMIVHIQKYK